MKRNVIPENCPRDIAKWSKKWCEGKTKTHGEERVIAWNTSKYPYLVMVYKPPYNKGWTFYDDPNYPITTIFDVSKDRTEFGVWRRQGWFPKHRYAKFFQAARELVDILKEEK